MHARAIVLVAAIAAAGCTGGATSAPPTTTPTNAPSPSPAALAAGTFTSHGVAAQLDARGSGADVTGTLTVSDEGGRATVALECARTIGSDLVAIGGLVTDSTYVDYFPKDFRVAIILKRGSPVNAVWWVTLASDKPAATCEALLADVPASPDGLEPIEGSLQLAP